MTILTNNDFVQLTLTDGSTLILTTQGYAFDGLDIPRTLPTTEVTGRSKKRAYESTGVHDYTFPFTVRHNAQTDPLLDEVGNTIAWERGIDGTASGKSKQSGSIIINSVNGNSSDEILMLTVAAQGTGDYVEGSY